MDAQKSEFNSTDLAQLKLPELNDMKAFLFSFNNSKKFLYSSRLTIRHEVSQADVFLYLLGRFGPPNGILSFLRDHHSQLKTEILWHYTLSWRKTLVHFIAHPYKTEIIFSSSSKIEITEIQFADLVKEGIRLNSSAVAKARQLVSHWHSFLNPLSHMLDACRRLLARAEYLESTLIKSRTHPITEEDIQWHIDNHEEHSITASELSGCCLSVRIMSPIVAEMFINLLVYNYYKKDLDSVVNLNDFKRGPILNKLEKLHIMCYGFNTMVDMNAPAISAFKLLMNRRNDLLHGNIIPELRKEDEFLMYKDIPIIKSFRSIYDRSIGPVINAFPISEAKQDFDAALGLINYLLECLESKIKSEVEPMLESLDLHQERKTKSLKALFTNIFSESVDLNKLYELSSPPN